MVPYGMDANTVIDRLGGTVAVAALCRVAPQAVSRWRLSGIPPARAMYLQVVHPEAFREAEGDAGPAGAAPAASTARL